jgi:hypothetical protein
MPRKTKKTNKAATSKTAKTAWLVEFGMLDRQRALVVVLTTGERPNSEQLSDAYEAIDGGDFTFDADFCPDEGTHHVYRQMTDQSAIDHYPQVDLTGEFAKYEAAKPVGPQPEVRYVWRELKARDGEKEPHLIVPWSDPYKHEHSFDFFYETPQDAMVDLREVAGDPETEDPNETDSWILCKMTLEPIPRPK